MMDYKTLKHSENGMPDWNGFLGPILQVAREKEIWKRLELIQDVLKEAKLPEQLTSLRYTSKWYDSVTPYRINWALSDLKISGLLNSPKRGMYQITDLGREISSKYGLNITRELVYSQPAYIEHQKKLQEKSSNDEEVSEEETFELTDTDPYKFEHMMVQF